VDAPPPERRDLAAGPVRAVLEGVDLRGVGQGAEPLVDRVYVAVRDRDWNTIPATITDLAFDRTEAGFSVTFRARHRAGDIDFAWAGSIEGSSDGVIRYTMDGAAESAFSYCRIGFCVLHPDSLAGAAYAARTPQGPVSGALPTLIAPQEVVDGFERPLFPACEALDVEGPDGARITCEFEGDLFEMEDQRNWTDASFKTYCTPIGLGYPTQAQPGQRIHQRVTMRIAGTRPPAAGRDSEAVARLTLGRGTGRGLPAIGFGMASDGAPLGDREQERLRALHPDHLRVDVRPARPGWEGSLDEAATQADQLDCGLEVALFPPDGGAAGPDRQATADVAAQVADRLAGTAVARWLVFDAGTAGTGTTPATLALAVHGRLTRTHPDAPVAGGTNGDFAGLNRARPDPSVLDAICYAVNPQVHASDDRSLLENVTAQGATVRTARSFADGRDVIVSPVTLAPRFNPAASGPEAPPPPGRLPSAVDPRQMSLLGAAWTVASIASLTAANADSVTWFETVGWRGLMERESGSPLPDLFASFPGMVFPAYHAFADLAEMRGAELLEVASSAPRSLAGLAVRRGDRVNGLLANLTATELAVSVAPVGGEVRYRVLDETTGSLATSDADAFRRSGSAAESEGGEWRIALRPYATLVFGTDVRPG
jgi:D-apionolactonase